MFHLLVFAACILFPYIFLSCNLQAEIPDDSYNPQTLRASALQTAEKIDWAFEEKDKLKNTETRGRFSRLPGGNSDNTAALFLADISLNDPVYPVAAGFTSLDTRTIPVPAYKLCERLIEAFAKKDLNADFFAKGYEFLKIPYEYELRQLPNIEGGIIGKARIDGAGVFEIPLRVTTETGFLYFFVYMVFESDTVKKISENSFSGVSASAAAKNRDSLKSGVYKIEQIIFEDVKK